MWFRSQFDSRNAQAERRPIQNAKHNPQHSREARRLFLEGLEDRSLMAFNVLADYATGAYPIDMALTSIDAGSQPDMVVVNNSDSTVSVRLGNADGTFGAEHVSATGTYPRSVAAGNFAGDASIDLVTANANDLTLLVGNGDGTFQPPTGISLPGTQYPLSVATGDLNGDGKLDLVVGTDTYFTQKYCYVGSYGYYYCNYSNVYDGHVNVLIGDGSGGFGPAETHDLGTDRLPYAVAVGNIDGGTNADVITSNSYDLSVLLGNGTGSVAEAIHSGSGYGLNSISLGDVDGDGSVDTVRGSGYGLAVQKGDGSGHFASQPSVSTGGPVNSAVIGDVNSDGKLDLVAVGSSNQYHCTSYGYWSCYGGYWTSTRQASVLIGNGLGGFAVPLTSDLGSDVGYYGSLPDVALADLTGDGLPELATVDSSFNKAIVATNDGDWNPPPSISISDAPTIVEGNSGTLNAVFTVSIVGAHSGSVSVNFATADSSAVALADYTAMSGTLTFGPGDLTPQTISVPVKGDTLDEYDEQFVVNLFSAVGGQITDSQGVVTIQDDDAAPLVTINDATVNEGNRGTTSMSFTVSLSAASGKWVYVNFATADGTGPTAATTGDNDYIAASGQVSFSPGQTTRTITVLVRGDKKKESNETFFVNLTGVTNGTISDSQGVGTIVNNDNGGGKGKPTSSNLAAILLTDDTLITNGKRK